MCLLRTQAELQQLVEDMTLPDMGGGGGCDLGGAMRCLAQGGVLDVEVTTSCHQESHVLHVTHGNQGAAATAGWGSSSGASAHESRTVLASDEHAVHWDGVAVRHERSHTVMHVSSGVASDDHVGDHAEGRGGAVAAKAAAASSSDPVAGGSPGEGVGGGQAVCVEDDSGFGSPVWPEFPPELRGWVREEVPEGGCGDDGVPQDLAARLSVLGRWACEGGPPSPHCCADEGGRNDGPAAQEAGACREYCEEAGACMEDGAPRGSCEEAVVHRGSCEGQQGTRPVVKEQGTGGVPIQTPIMGQREGRCAYADSADSAAGEGDGEQVAGGELGKHGSSCARVRGAEAAQLQASVATGGDTAVEQLPGTCPASIGEVGAAQPGRAARSVQVGDVGPCRALTVDDLISNLFVDDDEDDELPLPHRRRPSGRGGGQQGSASSPTRAMEGMGHAEVPAEGDLGEGGHTAAGGMAGDEGLPAPQALYGEGAAGVRLAATCMGAGAQQEMEVPPAPCKPSRRAGNRRTSGTVGPDRFHGARGGSMRLIVWKSECLSWRVQACRGETLLLLLRKAIREKAMESQMPAMGAERLSWKAE